MPDEFVPLDEFFRCSPPEESPPDQARDQTPIQTDEAASEPTCYDVDDALAGARRFRAALADAVDAATGELLRDIACDVLARELALAPADVAAIAATALERYAADCPVRLRAHPDETAALATFGVAVIGDPSLRRGDVALDLRDGTIDASLGARLDCVLAAR